jgi:DNA-binding GntR family transcriptional regulator
VRGSAERQEGQLSGKAYDRLLELILSGTFASGTLLQEQALAHQLKISRTPVREALVRLEAEGLVTRHAGRALVVREVSVQEFMEILRVRTVLETEAIGPACERIPAEKLRELRQMFESLLTTKVPDADVQLKADDALHNTIVDACGNSVLAELVRNLRRRTQFLNLRSLPDRFIPGCREHLAIVDALESRNQNTARYALADHLENVRQGILRRLSSI